MNAIMNPPAIRKRGGKFVVHLKSVGNPDYGQDPSRDMYGVPNVRAHVQTIAEAAKLCRAYIEYFDLGGGNWDGGELTTVDGLVIGRFSYNGRLWKDGKYPTPEIPVELWGSPDLIKPRTFVGEEADALTDKELEASREVIGQMREPGFDLGSLVVPPPTRRIKAAK